MELELTSEQIAQSVSAAFDSVALIKELQIKGEKTVEDIDCIERNKKHISIMMSKDWFVAALTNEQIVELQAI